MKKAVPLHTHFQRDIDKIGNGDVFEKTKTKEIIIKPHYKPKAVDNSSSALTEGAVFSWIDKNNKNEKLTNPKIAHKTHMGCGDINAVKGLKKKRSSNTKETPNTCYIKLRYRQSKQKKGRDKQVDGKKSDVPNDHSEIIAPNGLISSTNRSFFEGHIAESKETNIVVEGAKVNDCNCEEGILCNLFDLTQNTYLNLSELVDHDKSHNDKETWEFQNAISDIENKSRDKDNKDTTEIQNTQRQNKINTDSQAFTHKSFDSVYDVRKTTNLTTDTDMTNNKDDSIFIRQNNLDICTATIALDESTYQYCHLTSFDLSEQQKKVNSLLTDEARRTNEAEAQTEPLRTIQCRNASSITTGPFMRKLRRARIILGKEREMAATERRRVTRPWAQCLVRYMEKASAFRRRLNGHDQLLGVTSVARAALAKDVTLAARALAAARARLEVQLRLSNRLTFDLDATVAETRQLPGSQVMGSSRLPGFDVVRSWPHKAGSQLLQQGSKVKGSGMTENEAPPGLGGSPQTTATLACVSALQHLEAPCPNSLTSVLDTAGTRDSFIRAGISMGCRGNKDLSVEQGRRQQPCQQTKWWRWGGEGDEAPYLRAEDIAPL